jgi:hypothetical protein
MGAARWVIDTAGGMYELLRLGVITRFRFKGPYWQWRLHTAFGRGYPRSKLEMVRAVVEYAKWARRQRRGG